MRTFSENAIKFYLNSSDQERWAIRHFITADSNVMTDHDFLLNLEGYLDRRAKVIAEGKEKYFKIKPQFEQYVRFTDQRIIL